MLCLSFFTDEMGGWPWPPVDLRGGLHERTGSVSILKTLNARTAVSPCKAGYLGLIAPHGMQTLLGIPQKLSVLELKILLKARPLACSPAEASPPWHAEVAQAIDLGKELNPVVLITFFSFLVLDVLPSHHWEERQSQLVRRTTSSGEDRTANRERECSKGGTLQLQRDTKVK